MRDLTSIIRGCWNNNDCHITSQSGSLFQGKTANMIIPVNKEVFEIPTFILSQLSYCLFKIEDVEAFVLTLGSKGRQTSYKSLDAGVREALSSQYNIYGLRQITPACAPYKIYYGTNGAIFDENLQPVMMLSWQIEKISPEKGGERMQYKFLRPLLRVDPAVFIRKGNALERYVAGKMISTALSVPLLSHPYIGVNRYCAGYHDDRRFLPKVEIDKSPFLFRQPDIPSISTTNESLLNVVLDNIEEVLQ